MVLAVDMSTNFGYRPLPDCLTINPSDIEGLGLYAVKDIESGANLGISHLRSTISKSHFNLIRTPLGGFINHSDRPNCVLVQKVNRSIEMEIYDLVAAIDIKSGQELTTKYNLEQG